MDQGLGLRKLEEGFLNDLVVSGKSPNTLKNYRTDLECFNHFLTENKHPFEGQEWKGPAVLAYYDYLNQRYNSDNSRRRRLQALRHFFDYLLGQKVLGENPVKKFPSAPKFLDIPRPTPQKDLVTFWNFLQEQVHVTQGLEKLSVLRDQMLFLLIFEAGLKVSDLHGMVRADLMLSETPAVLIRPPRRDPYSIPLGAITREKALVYLKEVDRQMGQDHLHFDDLFYNANPYRILSGGLTSRGLEMIFKHYRTKLGLTLTPKSLRQSCIFKWLHQNKNETLVKDWLGVAPSYTLKPYRQHMDSHMVDDNFLQS